ncbi:MAG: hypothetical protein RR677_13035, partial [Acinetobacter sp.]
MENKSITYKTLWVSALILSLGFIISAGVIGYALKQFGGDKNSIIVKGLLDQEIKALQNFFVEHGFKATEMKLGNKSSQPYYQDVENEDGKMTREFRGYNAMQSLTIDSRDIQKIEKAAKDAYLLDEKGI